MHASFSATNFHTICDALAAKDQHLRQVIDTYGYPPIWNRPNTFETLVHIILEQQVSLASALAALNKLREKVITITPEAVLRLTDEELKACYFSRQKTVYVRHLAEAILYKKIDLAALQALPDDEIRVTLSQLKGIGNWTIDIYLIFVLQRSDIFPIGDLAAVNALKQLKQLPKDISRMSCQPSSLNGLPIAPLPLCSCGIIIYPCGSKPIQNQHNITRIHPCLTKRKY